MVLLSLCLARSSQSQETPPPQLLRFDRYYDTKDISKALTKLHESYPAFSSLTSMGQSYEGRELWVLTIRNPLTGKDDEKAAMYVDGNTHGNELQGSEVCLYLAHYLLTRYGRDDYVTNLVDDRVFYIAPCVNPDGREAFLKEPNTPHSSRRNRRPFDNDYDGLVDEDGYDDLDGDGRILSMRVRDPMGRWKTGADPRLMVRCKADEKGEFRLLGWEGVDNDQDGKLNEDGPGGVDLNRNFPSDWLPEHRQSGAGEYPLSEPETRATVAFLRQHKNIASIQSFHNVGAMILRPPGARPDDRGVPREDRAMYDALGQQGERMLPGYRYLQTAKDLYSVHGAFLDWGYMRYGVFSFSNELWRFPRDYNQDGQTDALEQLRWNDEMLHGRGFVKWYRVPHPQLGEVELGGWTKMARRNPPTWMLEDCCYRNTRFVLHHAAMMPRVRVRRVRSVLVEGTEDVHRIEAMFENQGYMATASARARAIQVARPDRVTVSGDGVSVLSVSKTSNDTGTAAIVPTPNPASLDLGHIPGRSRVKVVWLVKGKGNVTVTIQSEKGGWSRQTFRIT